MHMTFLKGIVNNLNLDVQEFTFIITKLSLEHR